jgi:2-polyprenyl-3-methyl-5-hydroxy-6-metoxy-1,4-benzoquinol methylase
MMLLRKLAGFMRWAVGTRRPKQVLASATVELPLNFPEFLRDDYEDVLEVCLSAAEDVRRIISDGGDYAKLAVHSPGLLNYDWDGYINLSVIRAVRVARALVSRGSEGQRVLDFGSYFGNFSLAARRLGFEVDALDSYARYAPALVAEKELLEASGVNILDSSFSPDIARQQGKVYDFIFCLGVIEHIPHSPKGLLLLLHDCLKDGGCLILDTPNLAYLYRREALARGESVFPTIETQFDSTLPFEGHHREFTQDEVRWMLCKTSFEVLDEDLFNYSLYGVDRLTGEDVRRFEEMRVDPLRREIIFACAQKHPAVPRPTRMPPEEVDCG